jgi:hypothetical protein
MKASDPLSEYAEQAGKDPGIVVMREGSRVDFLPP